MFEHFNCGIDYLLIVDHTKASVEDILQQLTETHTSSFFLGTFISTSKRSFHCSLDLFIPVCSLDTSPARKPIRLPQQPIVIPARSRTVQLKNISFKYPKPYPASAALANNSLPMVIKDRMKQPIANDKTRCAVLISTNGNTISTANLRNHRCLLLDTSLLSLLAYSTSNLDCAFEIVLVLSTLASLSDIARVNELYPSVVTKVIQPKKYAARHYDLVSHRPAHSQRTISLSRIRKSTTNCNCTAANWSFSTGTNAVSRRRS
jgi:hypothetical protein